MHEHDLDLIAAYADGATDDEDARRLVESCPVCRAEYDIHREITAVLSGLPQPQLSDIERSRLRREVHAALDEPLPETSTEVARVLPGPARWWTSRRLALATSVAAALFVTVGVASVLTQGGADEAADVAAETVAEEAELARSIPTTTAAAATEAAGAADDADDGVMSLQAPEAAERAAVVLDLGEVTVSQLESVFAETVAVIGESRDVVTADSLADMERQIPPCFDEVDGEVLAVIEATIDGSEVVTYVIPGEDQLVPRAFRADDCEPFPLG